MEISKSALLVFFIVAIVAIGAYLFVNTDSSQTNTVTVSGVSEIKVKPDLAVLYVNIDTLDKSAKESENKNAEISTKVMASLRELGFSKEEIETLSYNIYEDFSYNNNGRVSNGYKTTHQIKVSIEETDFIGTVIDRVVEDGAIVSSLQFELNKNKEQDLKAQALELATSDARKKAEAIARGSGGKLGSLVSITTSDYYYMPYMAYRADSSMGVAEAKAAATQIGTRELTVTANVQAVYKIR